MFSHHTDINSHHAGMGAIFCSTIQTIESLLLAQPKTIPKIKWTNLPFYSDKNDVNENIWDNYFEIIGFPEITSDSVYVPFPKKFSSCSSNPRISLNHVFQTHVKVKPIISNKVDEIFDKVRNYYTIGVHLRNTDRAIEPHFASPGVDKMWKHLQNTLQEVHKKYFNIALFIASDNITDADYIKSKLKTTFPSIVVLEDPNAIRSPNQISVHGTHDSGLVGISNGKKAESILVDIFSLARCNIVLRTCSNVTACSAFINKENKYIDISKIYEKFTETWVTQ
jgi:hypothetical protein